MLRDDDWWNSISAGRLKALLEQVDPSHQVAVSRVGDLVILDGAGCRKQFISITSEELESFGEEGA
jgi:hypothetical protein